MIFSIEIFGMTLKESAKPYGIVDGFGIAALIG